MKKINQVILLSIITYIPFYRFFQALLETQTNFSPSLDFWLSHWYEPVILILLFCNFAIFLSKRLPFSKTQLLSLSLLVFSFFSIVFLSPTVGRGLEGFRFMFLPVALFLSVSLAGLNDKSLQKIINTYLVIAVMMAIWSLCERFFPANYFVEWGILRSQDSWFGTHAIVGLKQGVALTGGPNLLAAYLLPAIFIIINRIKPPFCRLSTFYFLLSTCLLAFFLTFSRSALVALFLTGFIFALIHFKNWKARLAVLFSVILLIVAAFLAFQRGDRQVRDLFTHGASQISHQSSLQVSLAELRQRSQTNLKSFIFGSGLGTAGPSAMKYGDGIVSESWYFQVLLELGIVGLLFWLAFFYYALKQSWSDRGIFLGFFSILVMTAFLHTLSDNPAITLTIFTLLSFKKDNIEQKI